LLLDEPTNHLDMDSRAVLTEALRQFEGSVIFISHDRHLINAIGTKVIEVRDGRLNHYPGDWEYYQWKKAQENRPVVAVSAKAPVERAGAPATPTSAAQDTAPVAAEARVRPAGTKTVELGYKERKELSSRYRKIEKRILTAEERQKELATLMSDPAHMSDYELLLSAQSEATALADEITSLYDEWGKVAEALGTTAD
ncbi:MAG: ABC-F family ATP-binding cassette domain-containing protein, partial [Thermoleophilia bacterium]|nr:ABC-F family ATP-binding cassette domain-containing protein [Thermoleophilia bacterium]